jgi:hypothetical protein
MFSVHNDGEHDFGYPCFMPREITIDGLYVDDSNHPEGYQGLHLFCDPGGNDPADSPFPYGWCQKVKILELTTASGKKPRVSPNTRLDKSIVVVSRGDRG